ncbi:ATP-binding protein [Haliovirga abyssi]|uniref:(4Fe-4S)-binding protein n=1 Tax=Haliovirga abyssi TaxID=2996794 RepID=A0AAU9DTA2_9FUSO|nr:ATP-binding protein [Haliovirga abyssi]BDU50364.1 (4Fe-4S)-binding protein [Haliovirga abyssi]
MDINEIVIISGKGGTGKTTLTASLIPYFEELVVGDCDVDAPDLKILFEGDNITKEGFVGTKKAIINEEKCIKCGKCYRACTFGAITKEIKMNTPKCEGCGVCEYVCPVGAIELKDAVVGNLFVSNTNYGKMVHARLIPGEETSGKLVSAVRKRAKKIALEENKKNIIIDGAPGVACNVISSITGAKKVVIVTEPTFSGLHDLERVYEVTQKFRLPVLVVINKYDLSIEMSNKIEEFCKEKNIELGLKIPFNKKMVKAIVDKKIPSLAEKEFFDSFGFGEFIEKLKK